MTSSCSGRKCLHSVSRVGPTTPWPNTSIHGDYHSTAVDPSATWSVAAVLVVLAAGLVLLVGLVVMLVLRRKRLVRREVTGDNGGAAGKPGQDEVEEERKWSAGPGAVELVVMAGETKPTYLANPTIQCPPLVIPANSEDQ